MKSRWIMVTGLCALALSPLAGAQAKPANGLSRPVTERAPSGLPVETRSARRQVLPAYRVAVDTQLRDRTGFSAKRTGGGGARVQDLEITSAKKIRIRFLGYKELTGEYAINADATVSIPVLGRVSVAGTNAARLERILSNKVTSLTGRKGYATVEVTEYRPIFVTGTVKDAKSYPWTPGMTVLHAVSLAGGAARAAQTGTNIPLSTNSEKARMNQATNRLKRGMAQLARLRAERRGKPKIGASAELVKLVGKPEADRLIAAQQDVLDTSNEDYTNQFRAVREAIKAAREELKSMTNQAQLVKRQIELRRRHQRDMRKLKERRLVSGTQLLELETKLAETEEKSLTALVARARLQGRLLDLQRDLLIIKQKRAGALDKEILQLEREIAEQEIIRDAARKAILALTGGVDPLDAGGKPREPGFELVRQTRKGPRTLRVDRFTRLSPGDVLVVSTPDSPQ